MIQRIDLEKARNFFNILPKQMQIASYSPDYVYIDSFRNPNLEPIFLLVEIKKKFALIFFHLVRTKIIDVLDLISAYGYGETLYSDSDQDFISLVNNYLCEWCRKKNILVKFNRHHPLANNFFLNCSKIYTRNTISIILKEKFFLEFNSSNRNEIRQLIKIDNIKISNEFNIDAIVNLYNEHMKVLKARDFFFFNKNYFNKLLASNYVKIFCAYKDKELIGFVITLFSKISGIAEYFISSTSETGRKLKVNKLLLYSAADFFYKNNLNNFYLGGGRTNDDKDSLFRFKSTFSKNKLKFYISAEIFDIEKYNLLKNKFYNKNNILFYREDI
jgi:hypothetical protein